MDARLSEDDTAPELLAVLEGAARLQEVVPEAVLVGSAGALHAGHRLSFDHGHVLDLQERYQVVLEAVEATEGWATSVRASTPPMTLMGELGGIEAGLRQLRRSAPLETERVTLPSGRHLNVPTLPETLRVKGYLVLQRNQVRDYLDVVALADRLGEARAVSVLLAMDKYYADRSGDEESVATALAERLARPSPRDTRTLRQLHRYKGLAARWQDWAVVEEASARLADGMLDGGG